MRWSNKTKEWWAEQGVCNTIFFSSSSPRHWNLCKTGSTDSTGTGGEIVGQSGGRLAHRHGGAPEEEVP